MSEQITQSADCKCIAMVNEAFAREMPGVYLRCSTNVVTGERKPIVAAERLTGKGRKAPIVIPNFCPFCGVAYASEGSFPKGGQS